MTITQDLGSMYNHNTGLRFRVLIIVTLDLGLVSYCFIYNTRLRFRVLMIILLDLGLDCEGDHYNGILFEVH